MDEKSVLAGKLYDAYGAAGFDLGNPVDLIRNGIMPAEKSATDPKGLATGIMKYTMHLGPKKSADFNISVPFYGDGVEMDVMGSSGNGDEIIRATEFWDSKVDHIRFNLPPSADRIINTYKTNLIYILINRDNAGIQPGSRSYERSWIRDGALTSSALLKSGIVPEVKDFIDWYSSYLYENGKVPCVVDVRGPDPVPENDSHGEFIYLIREYFNFTKDTAFLRSQNKNILQAVDYVGYLVAPRSTYH